MEHSTNNNYEKVITYDHLDKELRNIKKRKRKKKSSISSFFKRQASILRYGTLYTVDHQFVEDVISLINAFYLKKSVSSDDMLIRRAKINFYREFKNSIRIPVFLTILTGIFFVISNIFSSTKEMFNFLVSNVSNVTNTVADNLDKLIGNHLGIMILLLFQFLLVVILYISGIVFALVLLGKAIVMFTSLFYVRDMSNFIEGYESEILDRMLEEYLNEKIFTKSNKIELVCNDPIKIIFDARKCQPEVKRNTVKQYLLNLVHKNQIKE